MTESLEKIEGRKFCVVFVKVIDEASGKVSLQCFRGRANVERGRVSVVDPGGASFTIPGTAVQNILPNDGTALLKDAEYFCFVKVDPSINLASSGDVLDVESTSHDHCCDENCSCHGH